MSFVFPRAGRSSLADLPLSWLVWLPLMPVMGGAVVLVGYLAEQQLLGVATLIGLGLSLGGAIALSAWVSSLLTRKIKTASQQKEGLQQAVLNALPDLIMRMHRDGTYLDIKLTDAYPTLLTPDSVGKNIQDLVPHPIAQKHLQAVQRALETRTAQVYESPFWVNGQFLWEEIRIVPLTADEVVIIIRDLSQRLQMETALRQSATNLRQAQRIAQVGSWEFDWQTSTVTWSEEMFRIFGFEPNQAEPSYDQILAMIPPADCEQLERLIKRAIADHTPYCMEHRIQRPDGTQRYIVSRGEVVDGAPQQGLKLCGTALDITDRKQAEIALQESEARFRQLAETVEEGFFVFEVETAQYSYLNPAIVNLTGLPKGPLPDEPAYARGMSHWLSNIHPEDLPQVEAQLQQERQGEPFDVEYRFMYPDGHYRWIRSKAFPLEDELGNTVRVVGTVEDITDRKVLEASLRSQAERERLLATITQRIRQSLDLEEILATTVRAVQETLKADRALIFKLDAGGSGQIIQQAAKAEYLVTNQIRWEDERFSPEIYEHYRRGQPRIVPNVAADGRAEYLADSMHQAGVKSKVVAPIVQGARNSPSVWGLLIVHACSHYRQWQDSEIDLLQRLSNQLAIAIDQASLFQQLQSELAERKQAELALQESETRFAEIAQTLNQVSYVISVPSAKYLYISPSYERLWGYSCESLYRDRKSWLDKIHPEDLDYVLEGLTQLLEGAQKRLQYRIFAANGEIRWIESESLIVRDEDGNPLRIVGIADDITNRKQLEQALQENEELFRRAFDDAPIGISLISPEGRYLRVNKGYCDLLGYSQEELLQMHFQDLTHPDDLEVDVAGFAQIKQGAIQTLQTEKRYIAKNGTIVPISLSASFIRDADGTPLYCVGHIQDIRERLKIDRMKDEFVSIVSHELRTPITSIEGSLTLLGSGVYDTRPQKAKAMLDIAIQNSHRLVRLVDDILSFERLESGKVELMMESCQVEDLQQQAIDSVSAIADRAAVTLRMTPCSATLYAAPDALMQTLTNLLSNAIKFSNPRQMVWLEAQIWHGRVRAPEPSTERLNSPSAHPAQWVLFSVKDQGRGIPADKLDNIFDQFQQVDVSDARQKGGTGLGLAICKRIVQQHGGDLWVESQLGQGSTFYFTVPLWQAGDREIEQENQLND
jgi:PAS domain S-box-containing protein